MFKFGNRRHPPLKNYMLGESGQMVCPTGGASSSNPRNPVNYKVKGKCHRVLLLPRFLLRKVGRQVEMNGQVESVRTRYAQSVFGVSLNLANSGIKLLQSLDLFTSLLLQRRRLWKVAATTESEPIHSVKG